MRPTPDYYASRVEAYEWNDTLSDGSEVRVTAYNHPPGVEIVVHERIRGFGWSRRRVESDRDYDRLKQLGEEAFSIGEEVAHG